MSSRHYFKTQSLWTRIPAAIESHRCDSTIGVAIHPEKKLTDMSKEPARIFLTAHEAHAFAAWLSQQADMLIAAEAKAIARKAARLAAKAQRESQS